MKSKSQSLESKRPLFFTAGLLFAVSLALVSFEWRTPYDPPVLPHVIIDNGEPVWIPVTIREPELKKEKPSAPKKEKLVTSVNPVDEVTKESVDEPELLTKDNLPELDGPVKLTDEEEAKDLKLDKIWERPGVMPEYCGGETAMFKFLYSELVYPEIPRQNGISGKVYVRFVIGKNGKLRDAEVIRPVDPWLDAEALRVAKMLNCFSPGRQAGQDVDVYFILPISFVLK